ncbi:hypothetical protein GCM10017673_37800 [Streptosporangium violaceochromogenes]|nr:hypothetical protein GCM10017673_37800 [Streptosporangium violaceochromogenes]
MRLACAATALVFLAAASACGSGAAKEPTEPGTGAAPAPSTAPAAPAVLPWATPATVKGKAGHPVKVTPAGVLYTRGGARVKPAGKWLAAISLRLEAAERADYLAPPADGGGFFWLAAGSEEPTPTSNGESVTAPWVGRVASLMARDLQPGAPESAVIEFDLPRSGGTLLLKTPSGQTARWTLPARTTGRGLDGVRAALAEFGITS